MGTVIGWGGFSSPPLQFLPIFKHIFSYAHKRKGGGGHFFFQINLIILNKHLAKPVFYVHPALNVH